MLGWWLGAEFVGMWGRVVVEGEGLRLRVGEELEAWGWVVRWLEGS